MAPFDGILSRLTGALTTIHRTRGLDRVLATIAEEARDLIGAHLASVRLGDTDNGITRHAAALTDQYAPWRDYDEAPDGGGIYRRVLLDARPLRLAADELERHPDWRGFGAADAHPPLRGLLAVPLLDQNGRAFGVVQLSHKFDGEFDDIDELLLANLAEMAAVAVENARLEDDSRQPAAELQRAHQAAEAALNRAQRIIETSPDVMAILDARGRFVEVGPRCEDIWGYSPDTLVGRTYLSLLHPDDRDATAAVGRSIKQTGRSGELQNRFMHSDGTAVPILWTAVWSADEQLFYAFARDIRDRVAMEEQLRQAQRLEAVGQLTGGVAHDFNNLLTVILGSAETMIAELPADHQLRIVAEMTRTAAERGADLTNGLLAFARRQALAPKVTDVNRLVANMDGLLRRTFDDDIEIELVRGGGLWSALVDPAQLEASLLNLALNARDAMPNGGRLTIETANVHLDDRYAAMHDEVEAGQYVLVAVADTGAGMAPDVVDRAFEPFFTTKEVGKGSGLGLSMVYGFTKQSGGHVKVYSELGFGTVVKLYLPRAREREQPEVERHGDTELDRGAERILLVEDDDLVREHVERQLQSMGYRVTAVRDGASALDVMRHDPNFDLLFTDVVMPGGMNGRQLAEAVHEIRPDLPVLFTSGYTENAIVHHGRLDPGVHLIQKPYRRQELAAKLRRLLHTDT
jgi:PAS domain S-box-containing protein